MSNEVRPVRRLSLPFSATLTMPGSKSIANRAIIIACLADGTSHISNATPCDDVVLMVENLSKMGFRIRWTNKAKGELEIMGGMPESANGGILYCGNAGTTLRFLSSIACLVPGEWTITGDENMMKRPVTDLVEALRSLGANIAIVGKCPPLHIKGGWLRGGKVQLNAGTSSQFLSSLLMIGPQLVGGLEVSLHGKIASQSYVHLTETMMACFGVHVRHQDQRKIYRVEQSRYGAQEKISIEGDWSAAGAFLALSTLTNGNIQYTNLDPQSRQGDRTMIDKIASMQTVGDITIDCSDCPDQVMNIALLAAYRKGKTTLIGAKNLRVKECDRLQVITAELTKAGIDIVEQEDGVSIDGHAPHWRGRLTLDPHDDHRMAMCFALLGALEGNICVRNPSCVKKSYPRFFHDLAVLYRMPKPLAIIGMRGCGKTNLGKKLAAKLGLRHEDTDAIFRKKYGEIALWVKKNSWQEFRKIEEKIVAECLQSGVIVSLGGGAIESERTREHLRSATVLWMQMSERGTLHRLAKTDRPPLTSLPLAQEVKQLHATRDPLYRKAADYTLPEGIPFSRQLSYVLKELQRHPAFQKSVHSSRSCVS